MADLDLLLEEIKTANFDLEISSGSQVYKAMLTAVEQFLWLESFNTGFKHAPHELTYSRDLADWSVFFRVMLRASACVIM